MAEWEYFTAKADAWSRTVKVTKEETKSLHDYLGMMGENGWELVAVAPIIVANGDAFDNYHML